MDKIMKITLGLFLAILIGTLGVIGYSGYIDGAYKSSLASTYTYTWSITTDTPLYNVTLFMPVPADTRGNSPIVSRFSAQEMTGIPGGWKTTLFDTGKATVLKVTIPSLLTPDGTHPANPYKIIISAELPAKGIIDTANPVENSALYHPISDIRQVACDAAVQTKGGSPECFTFLTSVYADYTSDPNAKVIIASSITGKNSWKIFEPRSNEYTADIYLVMLGENKGWTTAQGTLARRIGSYESPFQIP